MQMLKILAEEIVSQRCSFYFQDPVKAPPQKGTVTYSIYSYCTAPPPPPIQGMDNGQWTPMGGRFIKIHRELLDV